MKSIYIILSFILVVVSSYGQIINIPDPVFKNKLISTTLGEFRDANNNLILVDANQDGEIQLSEALQVHTIYFNSYQPYVTNMTGIQSFENIRRLFIAPAVLTSLDLSGLSNLIQLSYYNNDNNYNLTSVNLTGLINLENLHISNCKLTSLNLSGLVNLTYVNCQDNLLTNLDVQGLPNLQYLECRYNQLTNLNLSNLTNLTDVHCEYNNLTQIDLNGLPDLRILFCTGNELNNIDVSDCNALKHLECSDNQLASIELTNLSELIGLYCNNNLLTSLDLSTNNNLKYIRCEGNLFETLDFSNLTNLLQINFDNNQLLKTINAKNNVNEFLSFSNSPNLQYICADETQIVTVQNAINYFGYSNCHVNSYCSFTPGGLFYSIEGNNKFDLSNNGCEVTDINYPNLKLSFSDGINFGSFITDTSGSYHYDFQAGTQTCIPILENPNYFTVSPTSLTVVFPDEASPFIQNFCVTANGVHNDVEITFVPLDNSIPGFDATYKIIYKNKGNQVSDGSLSLSFDDTVVDFVSAFPINSSSATNSLTWTYSNLNPFETREIDVVFNINSPMETPAVNADDILSFTASIVGATDETPLDNTMTLNQIVVNSFDPNDKTCLEGNTISPEMVGGYVHYVIRFENTGTFAAKNVVVADIIDTTKFQTNTLIPQSSSHNFFTRINGNKVEFIFENINLPFDDENNDGYLAFKIKTKPTLVLGNEFKNTANIYFDYNFPIITNTTSTTVGESLGIEYFDFKTNFILYPNPSKDVLNIKVKKEIEVKSVSIYNTLGQIIMTTISPENGEINISKLQSESYFVKVITDKGSSIAKFIKK